MRKVKGFWILETEILELKTIFYTEIFLDFMSIGLMAVCFYIWSYEPKFVILSIVLSVISLVFAGAGVYLTYLQSAIWRRVREETTEAILGDKG